MSFKLGLHDFAVLSTLVVGAMGVQYLVTNSQISASESRVLSELKVASVTLASSMSSLNDEFKSNSEIVLSAVNSGMEAREQEVLISISKLVGDDFPFALKVSNIPVPSPLHDQFMKASVERGNTASVFSVNSVAMGILRVSNLNDPNFLALKRLLEEAASSIYKDVGVQFEFNPDDLTLSRERQIVLLKTQIEKLQRQVKVLEQ